MSLFCRKNLSPVQRRAMRGLSPILVLAVLTNFAVPGLRSPLTDVFPALQKHLAGHPSPAAVLTLSMFSALPVLLAVWVAGRYLAAESDEFIRGLVMHALLWGFAATMAGDAVAAVYMNMYGRPFPLVLLSMELFFVSSALAFRNTGARWLPALPAMELSLRNCLRDLRAERNWSQADLAERLEVSRQSVNALETGKFDPSLPLAFRLAELFQMPIESIFFA